MQRSLDLDWEPALECEGRGKYKAGSAYDSSNDDVSAGRVGH